MEKKVAVVTGSTKGIGRAIGEKLLKEKYFVIFNYANDEVSAQELRKDLSLEYMEFEDFLIIKQNLEKEYDVVQFKETVLSYVTQIDVLILNAACTNREKWQSTTWEDWEHVMNVNVNAPSYLVRVLDSNIVPGGNIIFISSIMSEYTHSISIAYSVSKAAINSLAKSLVKEYCERNIRVNVVMPGFVNTPWQQVKTESHKKRITDKLSLHRFAESNEIANIVYSVIELEYLNGAIIDASGGYCYK